MKNLFIALAFMLMGTFAFANTTVEETNDLEKIESLIIVDDIESSEDVYSCGFPGHFDDGGSGDWGGSGTFGYSFECDTTTFWSDFFSALEGAGLGNWDSLIASLK